MKKIIFLMIALPLMAGACQPPPVSQYNYEQPSTSGKPTPVPVARTMKVKVAIIALNDNGKSGPKIGCEDSVVYIEKKVTDSAEPMNAAFNQLFALPSEKITDPAYPDLYNVLYKLEHKTSGQPLRFSEATLSNGEAKIYLTGDMTGLGGICDSPRVQAQIDQTALQFSTVKTVTVYLNKKLVDWQKFNSQK